MSDSRSLIVDWARWGVAYGKANKGAINYSEGSDRMDAIGVWPLKFPINTDCSGSVTLWYWLAGAADPNGLKFDHEGYTGTLLSHDAHIAEFIKNAQGITVDEVLPGDLVVYGPGTGEHVALVVNVSGADILTVSHGEQGDPSYVWVNAPTASPSEGYPVDGRQPQTFLRCNTTTVGVAHPVPTVG